MCLHLAGVYYPRPAALLLPQPWLSPGPVHFAFWGLFCSPALSALFLLPSPNYPDGPSHCCRLYFMGSSINCCWDWSTGDRVARAAEWQSQARGRVFFNLSFHTCTQCIPSYNPPSRIFLQPVNHSSLLQISFL